MAAMSTPLPPGRVSIQDVERALLLEFERTQDVRWIQLTRGALRNLKHRRRISPGPGFDVVELTRYLDARHARDQPVLAAGQAVCDTSTGQSYAHEPRGTIHAS